MTTSVARQGTNVAGAGADVAGNLTGLGKIDMTSALRSMDMSSVDLSSLRSVDGAAGAGTGAGRKLDGAAGAAGDAAGANRKVDDAAGAAGDAAGANRKVDDAAGAGKKADKADTAMMIAGTALVAGALLYLDDKIADEEKEIKACVGTCLPSNWDDYEYGNLQKEELTYQSIDTIKAEFPDEEVDPKQPFCKEEIEECGDFCLDKCRDIHESSLPGGELLGRGAREAREAVEDAADTFLGPLKDMLSSIGDAIKTPLSIAAVLVILLGVWFIFFK